MGQSYIDPTGRVTPGGAPPPMMNHSYQSLPPAQPDRPLSRAGSAMSGDVSGYHPAGYPGQYGHPHGHPQMWNRGHYGGPPAPYGAPAYGAPPYGYPGYPPHVYDPYSQIPPQYR